MHKILRIQKKWFTKKKSLKDQEFVHWKVKFFLQCCSLYNFDFLHHVMVMCLSLVSDFFVSPQVFLRWFLILTSKRAHRCSSSCPFVELIWFWSHSFWGNCWNWQLNTVLTLSRCHIQLIFSKTYLTYSILSMSCSCLSPFDPVLFLSCYI